MPIAYQAYANGYRTTKPTPRQAAEKFFQDNPTRRKCDVQEGESEGGFFTVKLSLVAGKKSSRWKDVTKKTVATLPDTEAVVSLEA